MRLPALLLCSIFLLCAACGGEDTPTSPSPSTPTTTTERFDAILDLRGTAFYPFSMNAAGTVAINLASLSPLNRAGLLTVPVQIGYGTVVNGDDGTPIACAATKTIEATPGLTSQLMDTLTAATNYCATILDIGNLREAVNFSIRVTHS